MKLKLTFNILSLLLLCEITVAQLDSTVTFVNDTAKYKTLYDGAIVHYFKTDTLGQWYEYGKWEIDESSIYFYNVDSTGELLTTIASWSDDVREHYNVDSTGNLTLIARTVYYGNYNISTSTIGSPLSNVIVTISQTTMHITSTDIIYDVKVYDITGRLLLQQYPNDIETYIDGFTGILFLKIETSQEVAIKKIIL